MPNDAPRAKVDGTRSYGAEVVTYDRVTDDREAIAARFVDERDATLVKPYDDPGIMAGQGTAGLEIAEDAGRFGVTLDAVATPCSGGGLVTGVALALKGAGVTAPVHSVEPENFDGMRRSLAAHARVSAPGTSEGGTLSIADALMAPVPGHHVFALADGLLAPGIAVSDEELSRAVAFAPALKLKLLIEPGGTAALAALLAGKLRGEKSGAAAFGRQCGFRQRSKRGSPPFSRLSVKLYNRIRCGGPAPGPIQGACDSMDSSPRLSFCSVLLRGFWLVPAPAKRLTVPIRSRRAPMTGFRPGSRRRRNCRIWASICRVRTVCPIWR